jgi:hypothetical protein
MRKGGLSDGRPASQCGARCASLALCSVSMSACMPAEAITHFGLLRGGVGSGT